jgi:hypothetical protein
VDSGILNITNAFNNEENLLPSGQKNKICHHEAAAPQAVGKRIRSTGRLLGYRIAMDIKSPQCRPVVV